MSTWTISQNENEIILTDGRKKARFDLKAFKVPIWDVNFNDPVELIEKLYDIFDNELRSAPALPMIEATENYEYAEEVAYDIQQVLERINTVFDDVILFKDAIENVYERYSPVTLEAWPEFGDAVFYRTDLMGGYEKESVEFSKVKDYDRKDFLEFIDKLASVYSKISDLRSN